MTRITKCLPAILLFIVCPLVAEFLPGNMPVNMLGALVVLAPMYGGGALLIRETVRRSHKGWPSIFVLSLSYGVLEEGVIMQSLFNPNFLGLNQHLLQPAYIPTLGMGAWWTLFVLTLHTVWSVPVSIAISEALSPARADEPWLNWPGMGVVAVIFAVGCLSIGIFTVRNDPLHFVASPLQFGSAGTGIFLLIASAFLLPTRHGASHKKYSPRPSIIGFAAFLGASMFLAIPGRWGWWALSLYMVLYVAMIWMILVWSHLQGWSAMHRLALSGGAAIAYGLHSFAAIPAVGRANRIGNTVFVVALLTVLHLAARQIRGSCGGSSHKEVL